VAAVPSFLLNSLVSDFKKEAAKTGHDYDSQRQPKAAAVCPSWPDYDSEPHVLYWGDEWTDSDEDTPESIRREAIKQCDQAKVGDERSSEWSKLRVGSLCNCQLILQDSTTVLTAPDEVAKSFAAKLDRERVPELCPNWFGGK